MRSALAMRSRILIWLGFICAALAFDASAAIAQKRFAFVVGNGAYRNVAALPNAINDANATATVLREAGFDVVPALDSTLSGLRGGLDNFIGKLQQAGPGATALVYYAGHAIQLDGANYLLPIDVRPETSANIPAQALSLSDILKRLDATGAVAKIVILDACRNNPFAAQDLARGLSLQLVDGASDGIRSEAGLARIDSKSGTFVAFATSPGSTAADGAGANSPFTTALLRQIREPGLPVEQLFRRVRLDVHDATSGQQIPWDTSSLITNFSFFERGAGVPATPAQPASSVSLTTRPTVAALRTLSPADAYRAAIAWDRPDIYRGFLEVQPDDERALRVHRLVSLRTEETAWAETVRAGDAESFKMFARLYPFSQHVNEALRLAAAAPSRNRMIQTAAMCPVCPALAPSVRPRRAEYTPRSSAPPSAVSPRRYAPVQRDAPRTVVEAPAPVSPIIDVPVPVGSRWTGFYVGGFASAGWQNTDTTFGGNGPTDSIRTSIDAGNVPSRLPTSGDSVMGGGLIGFNWQTGAFVYGAEADFSAAHLGGSGSQSVNPFGVTVSTRTRNELFTLGTVRGRLGVAFGDLLIFGTGGYGYGHGGQSGSIAPDPTDNPTYVGADGGMRSGWVLGGGIEYALGPRISLKLDYLHYDLGTRTLTLSEITGQARGETAFVKATTRGELVRAGVNFRF
jgi:uncharacterized caspase-like protein/opacity protein-like surface antigen